MQRPRQFRQQSRRKTVKDEQMENKFNEQKDERIKKDIVDQLFWDDRVNAAEINVDVTGGHVILFGTVDTNQARTAAEEDARAIHGVLSLENQIAVRIAAPPGLADIGNRVERVLEWNPDIDHTKIDVTVEENGVVTLRGSVDALWKKSAAEELVHTIQGVQGVSNVLTVVPTENVVDDAVVNEILGALRRNMYIDETQIDVTVENGKATLSGRVPSWVAYRGAYQAAQNTPGVIEISNELTVNPQQE
jgi:osmotically-inducible protein OsmY